MAQETWTPEAPDLEVIEPEWFLTSRPVLENVDWVEANLKLIDVMGADTYLHSLIHVLRRKLKQHSLASN